LINPIENDSTVASLPPAITGTPLEIPVSLEALAVTSPIIEVD
jgi:hypothetical protein